MAELRTDLVLSVDAALRQVERLRAEASRALTIDVDVPPVDLGLGDDIASVQALDAGLGDVTEEIDEASSASDRLGTALKGALAVVGAREIIRGLKAIVDAASDLEESSSKAGVVFADSFGQVAEFAAEAAVNVGLSEQAAFEATATFGNLFTAQGLAAEAAADMSTSVVSLSADLASFNNLEVDETLDKIRSGLVGEIEPLRQLGVSFNAAQVEAKALELGLASANGEIDDGAKIQARYSLILEQTSAAQGDFARTSDGLANQQRILSAELGNAAAQLGQILLPAALDLVEIFRQDMLPSVIELGEAGLPLLVEGFEAVAPIVGTTTELLVALIPVIDVLVGVIDAIPESALSAAGGVFALSRGMRALGVTVSSGRVAAIVAAAAAVGALADSIGLSPDAGREFAELQRQIGQFGATGQATGRINDVTEALDRLADRSVFETVNEGLGTVGDAFLGLLGIEGPFERLGRALADADTIAAGLVSDGNIAGAVALLVDQLGQLGTLDVDELAAFLPGTFAAIDETLTGLAESGNISGAQDLFAGLAGAFDDVGVSATGLVGNLPDYVQAIRTVATETGRAIDPTVGLGETIDTLAESFGAIDDTEGFQEALEALAEFADVDVDDLGVAFDILADPSGFENVSVAVDRLRGLLPFVTTDAERAAAALSQVDDVLVQVASLPGGGAAVLTFLDQVVKRVPGLTFREAIDSLPLFKAVLEGLPGGADAAIAALEATTGAADDTGEAFDAAAAAVAGYGAELDALLNPVTRFRDAQDDVNAALEALADPEGDREQALLDLASALAAGAGAAAELKALGDSLPEGFRGIGQAFDVDTGLLDELLGLLTDIQGTGSAISDEAFKFTIDFEAGTARLTAFLEDIEDLEVLPVQIEPELDERTFEERLDSIADLIVNETLRFVFESNLDEVVADIRATQLQADILTAGKQIEFDSNLPMVLLQEAALSTALRDLEGIYNVDIDVDVDTSGARSELVELVEQFGVIGVRVPGGFIPAQHGLIADPTPGGHLVRVAEAGVREVIIPVDDASRARALADASGLTGLLGGGRQAGDINISVVGAVDPDAVATKTADELAAVMLRAGG